MFLVVAEAGVVVFVVDIGVLNVVGVGIRIGVSADVVVAAVVVLVVPSVFALG